LIFPLKIVIFHSYVKLPEGNIQELSKEMAVGVAQKFNRQAMTKPSPPLMVISMGKVLQSSWA
jgi:hypothetical protein